MRTSFEANVTSDKKAQKDAEVADTAPVDTPGDASC